MVRVFANGPGDLGSIPGRVIPKTQKMVFDVFLLNTQHYKVGIKGKVEQSRERCSALPTLWCSSYRKGSPRVTLDFGRQLYLLYYIYIYMYLYACVWVWVCTFRSHLERVTNIPLWISKVLYCNRFSHQKWKRWPDFTFWTILFTFYLVLIPLGKV